MCNKLTTESLCCRCNICSDMLLRGIEGTLDAIDALHSGDCLRAVVTY